MLGQSPITPKDSSGDVTGSGSIASPSDPGNLSDSLLDPSYARKIGRELYDSSTSWLNASRRQQWSDSLRAFQGLHPQNSKYLSGDYQYRSKLYRPKTRAMVRKGEANIAAAFFANEDVVSIEPENGDDPTQLASAAINKELLQYRLTKTIPWFLTLVGARQDADVMGICLAKVYWKWTEHFSHTEKRPRVDPATGMLQLGQDGALQFDEYDITIKAEDHPWIDLISPENFRMDAGADWRDPVKTSPYLIELIPMYVADVQEKIKVGEWLPVSSAALFNATSVDNDTTRNSREQGRMPAQNSTNWRVKPYQICWVRETIIRKGAEEVHFFSLNGSGELLTNPRLLKEVYAHGRPYVGGIIVPEAHKAYPAGRVELTRDLQTKANDVDNLRLDNVKMVLNPRQFVSAGYGFDPYELRRQVPGKVIVTNGKVNMSEVMAWDRPPEVTASSYAEQDKVDQDYGELIGGISMAQVQANKGVFDAVGNSELLGSDASRLDEYDMRVFTETFVEPVCRLFVKLEQHYETNATILALAGKKANLFQRFGINEITDFLLQQEMTLKVNVGLGATNPKQKLNNLLTAGTAVSKMFGPAVAGGINFDETWKEIFSLCGYRDGQRFLMPGFNYQQVLQQMAQGGKSKQDDPSAKIAEQKAEEARQQADDQRAMQQEEREHQYRLQEMEADNYYKQQDVQNKMQLEMWKHQSKLQAEQAHNQQMMAMSQRPAATVQFDAGEPLAKMLQEMQGGQQQMMQGLHDSHMNAMGGIFNGLQQVLGPVAQAAIAMSEVARTMPIQQEKLTEAIESLTRAQLAPRRGRRDKDGTLVSEVVQ